ncbi:ATP-binding protein [Actinoallomurus purpureus]|uniref:ATP-binding protein n=1 Tax=Actinoallomurus purpureus TaxID=478114 RepID=UPI0020932F1F|nr:ATP-binding protein [Actinoallomurus purpureus]MCO6004607.1 ATP-binding protein [Actinoallomurus purpureus]
MPLTKPQRVFDRSYEWSALARFATSVSPHARLGLVSGRRRQGKTFLLRALAEAAGGFYFTAVEATARDSLREFGVALAEHAGSRAPYALDDWTDALRVLSETVGDGLAIIDEFPYLIKADSAIPSIFQRRLDELASRPGETSSRFLLCGSSMSVMGRLLAANAPLRGRASMELLVNPFGYRTAAEFWQIDDPKLAVLVHSVVGGTPAYRQEFVGGDAPESLADFDDWVVRTVLSPSVPLFREARYLLAEETDVRDPALYNSVLGAIATGNATRGGIANYIGRKSSELVHPLNVLEDSGLIAREADPFHARRSRFRITEPLITFYEAVMRRAWTQLEQRQARQVWQRSRPTFLSQVVGPHFEAMCREWAARADDDVFGDMPGEVVAGAVADPVGKTQIEIDVAVLSSSEDRRILSLGEAKWGVTMGLRHLDRLRRARDLLSVKGYDTSETWLACYSGTGFDDELHAAAKRDRILLVDLERLYAT